MLDPLIEPIGTPTHEWRRAGGEGSGADREGTTKEAPELTTKQEVNTTLARERLPSCAATQWGGTMLRKKDPRRPVPAGDAASAAFRYEPLNYAAEFQCAQVTVDLLDVRFRRDVQRLHALGARSLYELLAELGATHLIRTPIETLVRCYVERLEPETVRAVGGDRFPPSPLYLVRRK